MEKIVAEYSFWYIPLCLLAGIAYAGMLYLKEKRNEYSTTLRWILAGIRLLVVSVIAFLLLNPLVRSLSSETEKPVVVILQDNSKSVVTGKDSTFYRTEYTLGLQAFAASVEEQYSVSNYTFDQAIHDDKPLEYSGLQTNLGGALEGIYNRFSHKNVGALVVLSDGINNLGVSPLYLNYNFDFPIYTVALGDTAIQRDLVLEKVNFNRIAYLENEFPVEINLSGRKCMGRTTEVTIVRQGQTLFSRQVSLNSDNEFKTLRTSIKATETGLQKYTIRLSGLEGEVSLLNNQQDIYIDVLEDKQAVLLLADAPHPDITAIKQAVAANFNYELEDYLVGDFNGNVNAFNLVILHGLPTVKNNATAILEALRENAIPTLFILTKKTFLPLFNEQKTGLVIGSENLLFHEALPAPNPEFGLFQLPGKTLDAMSGFPPLISPYGNLQLSPAASAMLFQKVGPVTSGQPLWIFNQDPDRKTSVLLGPGIWKWRIKEYASAESHAAFDDMINKSIQYLALRVDKSLFRVYGKNNYTENAEIEFQAELYNEVYELINDKDVAITLSGSDGTDYPFTFTTTSKAYYLNAGNLPADSYTYEARVVAGGETLTERGEFTVSSTQAELLVTQADHNLLYNLAAKYGGNLFYPDQLPELAETIKNRDDIKPVTYYQKRFSELLNLPWLLALLLLLLSAEWFTRKRAGGY